MGIQQHINYERIEKAIQFINDNVALQPSLSEVAAHVHVSPFHFQKLFTEWAGVSPKKFLQYITLSYAKSKLQQKKATLFDAALDVGLTSASQLHHLFISIEGMSPAAFKNEGENLQICYACCSTYFGNALIAATDVGICYVAFYSNVSIALALLKSQFLKAIYKEDINIHIKKVIQYFLNFQAPVEPIPLHLKGTPFQLKVWQALLTIPQGSFTTYGQLSSQIQNPKAARAVGTAIGSNPVAFLIPCHRVIQSTGIFGGYMWGKNKKAMILGWEAAKQEEDNCL